MKIINNIYLFILILSLIGLGSGYTYYQVQTIEIKNELITMIDLKEELSSGVNNIPKRFKVIIKTLINSLLVIPQLVNLFNIFYMPFQTGFVLNLLDDFSLKFSLIYIFIYHIIPIVFNLFLIKISFNISKALIELLLYRDKLGISILKRYLKRYVVLSFVFIFYEFIVWIFSSNINAYLVTFIV